MKWSINWEREDCSERRAERQLQVGGRAGRCNHRVLVANAWCRSLMNKSHEQNLFEEHRVCDLRLIKNQFMIRPRQNIPWSSASKRTLSIIHEVNFAEHRNENLTCTEILGFHLKRANYCKLQDASGHKSYVWVSLFLRGSEEVITEVLVIFWLLLGLFVKQAVGCLPLPCRFRWCKLRG